MSRSALWRQEANVKERERQAVETFHAAIEEGRSCHVKGAIAIHGPDDTFNLNSMLLHNISKSPYFIKCCNKLKDWNALVDEIYYEVKHMEPWTAGASKIPSTAFCLLVRLFTLRCTEKQMTLMLNHVDSPYIRCIGFLYLRYATDPAGVWDWFQPYLYDEEPVRIEQNMSKPEVTVGDYVRALLTEMNYHGTLLPRLPVALERDVKVKLLQAEQIENRAQEHLSDEKRMEHFQRIGSRVRALYGDEENPTTWYDAVVDRVVTRDEETGLDLTRPKFWVSFPEYGNTEMVTLGEIDMPAADGVGGCGQGGVGNREFGGRGRTWERERDWKRERSPRRGERGRWDEARRGLSGRDSWCRDRGDSRDARKDSIPHQGSRGYQVGDAPRRGRDAGDRDEVSRDRWERGSYFNREEDDRRRRRSRSRERDNGTFDRGDNLPPPGTALAAPDERDLMEEVLRREREKSAAKGKAYASRPPTFKTSLALKQGEPQRKRSRSPDGDRFRAGRKGRAAESPPRDFGQAAQARLNRDKTPEELAAIDEKKRKLLARYG